ncbi:hypothetical protein Tco_0899262 [Tanacetum coccineum]
MVKIAPSKLKVFVLRLIHLIWVRKWRKYVKEASLKEVVERFVIRLSRWKMKLLSIGGRLTLLKSVLGSMPIFHMSIFKVPSSILKSLESIRSRFFNGQDPKSNKASWVSCSSGFGGSILINVPYGLKLHPIEAGDCGENTGSALDYWNEAGVIKELFPRMFALELNKNATVSSKLNASSLDNSFRRKARSGIEEMQLNSLVVRFLRNDYSCACDMFRLGV